MTRTNHSDIRDADDFYRTPAWCVEAVLPHLRTNLGRIDKGFEGRVLDPGCGDGAISEVILDVAPRCSLVGIERDTGRSQKAAAKLAAKLREGVFLIQGDFLAHQGPELLGPFDLVIGNPPFSRAMDFVQRSLTLRAPGGVVAMLLRLPWLSSGARSGWLRLNTPGLKVLPRRPEFAMSVRCKNHERYPAKKRQNPEASCTYEALLPTDADRPSKCVLCGGGLAISTSDATEYAWYVWGDVDGPTVQILETKKKERRRRAPKGGSL